MKRMSADFYEAVADRIRKDYSIITDGGIWYGDTEIDGSLYSVTRPSYDFEGHYVFQVKDYRKRGEVVASGEVSAQYIDDKKIRFYAGEAILHAESL